MIAFINVRVILTLLANLNPSAGLVESPTHFSRYIKSFNLSVGIGSTICTTV